MTLTQLESAVLDCLGSNNAAEKIRALFDSAKETTADLQWQIDESKRLLGYDDGDLLDNVRRYKKYAESEIALRDKKAKEGIAYIERLQEGRWK